MDGFEQKKKKKKKNTFFFLFRLGLVFFFFFQKVTSRAATGYIFSRGKSHQSEMPCFSTIIGGCFFSTIPN